jgi:predicted metal-dependent enzyme (double-stranded beta helix superfamily)
MTAVFDRPNSALSPSEPLDFIPPGLPPADLAALVRRVAGDVDRWLPRLQLPDGNDRWWTRLAADDRVDVWLLSWLPGHNTDLHDHGDSAAAFTVVRGSLSEIRIDGDGQRTSHVRATGSATSLGAGVIHDVTGAGTQPAVSIHAYSPPLTRMNYFDPATLRVVRTVQSNEPEEELSR